MDLNNFNEDNFNKAMVIFFDKLNIDPIEFKIYNKEKLISKKPFIYDDNDSDDYYIVVKIYNNIGTVSIGISNGPKFIECEVLGQIEFRDNKWVNV